MPLIFGRGGQSQAIHRSSPAECVSYGVLHASPIAAVAQHYCFDIHVGYTSVLGKH